MPFPHPRLPIVAVIASVWVAGITGTVVIARLFGSSVPLSPVSVWPLLAAAAVAERANINIRHRRNYLTLTLSEAVLAFSLVHLPALQVLVVMATGAAVELVRARVGLTKLLFNLGSWLTCAAAAVTVFHGLEGPSLTGPTLWLSCLGAAMAANALSASLVSIMIRLYAGSGLGVDVRTVVAPSLATAVVNTVLGLVVSEVYRADPRSLLLLVPIAALVAAAYRAYAEMLSRNDALELLHASVLELSGAPDQSAALGQLLMRASQGLRADLGAVILRTGTGTFQATRFDGHGLETVELDPALVEALGEIAQEVGAAPCPPGHRALAAFGANNLLVAELRTDRGMAGLLVVGQVGRIEQFKKADTQLLHALATHAATVLRLGAIGSAYDNLRSEQAVLEHDANHDPLTGLANRRAVLARLGALSEHGLRCGVVYVDLDGFKPINDRWGHRAGDAALVAVADRLRSAVRPGDLVGRLGGDEFVVIVEEPDGLDALDALGRRIHARLGSLDLPEVPEPVTLGASVGIALGNLGSESGACLLARADTAMYQAKSARRNTSGPAAVAFAAGPDE